MSISGINTTPSQMAIAQHAASQPQNLTDEADALQQSKRQPGELREAFDRFVGETFYAQLLGAMRQSVDRPAYFHGGRGEEVFQSQLDQVLSENISKATADTFTGPMFELFNLSNLQRS